MGRSRYLLSLHFIFQHGVLRDLGAILSCLCVSFMPRMEGDALPLLCSFASFAGTYTACKIWMEGGVEGETWQIMVGEWMREGRCRGNCRFEVCMDGRKDGWVGGWMDGMIQTS